MVVRENLNLFIILWYYFGIRVTETLEGMTIAFQLFSATTTRENVIQKRV